MKSSNLILYPDADIRLAFQRAIAKETTRGWRIAKEKSAHKIDVVVALGMAALIAAKDGPGHRSYTVGQLSGRQVGHHPSQGSGNVFCPPWMRRPPRPGSNIANPQSPACKIDFGKAERSAPARYLGSTNRG